MANEQDRSLAAKHLHIWGLAAQLAGDYMSLKRVRQGQEDQEVKEAKVALVAELAALLEVAQQLDKELPAWQRVFYVKATQNMIEACGIMQQEIEECLGAV